MQSPARQTRSATRRAHLMSAGALMTPRVVRVYGQRNTRGRISTSGTGSSDSPAPSTPDLLLGGTSGSSSPDTIDTDFAPIGMQSRSRQSRTSRVARVYGKRSARGRSAMMGGAESPDSYAPSTPELLTDDGTGGPSSSDTVDGFVLVTPPNQNGGEPGQRLEDYQASARNEGGDFMECASQDHGDFLNAMRGAAKCREVISSKMEDLFDRISQEHRELLNETAELYNQLKVVGLEKLQLREELQVARTAYLEATDCPMCFDHLSRPFTPGCGHIFCAPCLRRHLRASLERRLQEVPFLLFYGYTSPYDLYEAPNDIAHQNALVAGIQADGRNPHDFFKYKCPTCRHLMTAPPAEVNQMTVLLQGVRCAFDRQFPIVENGQVDEAGVNSANYFTPLFINP